MFSKRHYEWLASFAGRNLNQQQRFALATALKADNPAFKMDKFLEWARRERELAGV